MNKKEKKFLQERFDKCQVKFDRLVDISVDGYRLKKNEFLLSHLTIEEVYFISTQAEEQRALILQENDIDRLLLDSIAVSTHFNTAMVSFNGIISDLNGNMTEQKNFTFPTFLR